MEVSFIGSGNLAWHLAPALDNAGYPVREVYSPQSRNAGALVGRLYNAAVCSSLDFSGSSSRLFFIAVPDEAIVEVVREIVLPDDAIVVHTSGSQPLSLLEDAATSRLGVFYPFQTFSKTRRVDFNETLILVEGNSEETSRVLLAAARAISRKVNKVSSEDRKALHLAAMFGSNFTNHMLTLSRDIMTGNKLDFDWLKPLILETVNKALTIGPEASQTGPARRGDLQILDMHMEMLKNEKAIAEIYRVISQNIVDRYS